MKIGYYIHHTSLKAGGIFTYSVGVFKLLLASDEIQKLILIISTEQKKYFQEYSDNNKLEIHVIDRNSFFIKLRIALQYFFFDTYTIYKNHINNPAKLNFLKKISFFLNPYKKIIKSYKIDLLHIPVQFSPIYGCNIPVIITMHDLQEYHFPEYFDTTERLHRALNGKKAIEEADHTIVSFEHVKDDIIKYFSLDSDEISVCPPPVTLDWFLSDRFTSAEDLKPKFNLENEFLLYPAATWKHKNHSNLFNALSLLNKDDLKIQLICTGNKTDYHQYLQKEIDNLGLNDKIKFLGIVTEEDLIGLYKCTSLVVIPTKYEAGSGPLYEAMKYSAPVICSNVTSLPETISNNDFIFNPDDPDEIAQKIKLILHDKNFRAKNITNSAKRLEDMGKTDYAESFINVYKKILEKTN